MTAALIPTPVMQFLDADGNPLVGGKVYTYAAGTSTPLATFTDYGGATPNANPVILNSRGEASIWFGTAAYKLELYTAATVLIWTADNVSASTPVVYGTGVAAALAINVGTAGSILVNGGALVGTTLSASGTATMAAINASGTVAMAGAATVGTTLGVTGVATFGVANTTPASIKLLNSAAGTSSILFRNASDAGTNASINVDNATGILGITATYGLSVTGTLGVTGTSTMAAINASGVGTFTSTGEAVKITPTTATGLGLISFNNTGGTSYIGTDNSTASFFGKNAYGIGLNAIAGSSINLIIGSTSVLSAVAAGVTIPGTVSLTATNGLINSGTTNGSDNKTITISGGGANSAARGANFSLSGNESTTEIITVGGDAILQSGDSTGAAVYIYQGTAGQIAKFSSTGLSVTGTLGVTGATTVTASVSGNWVGTFTNTNTTDGYGLYAQGANNASTYLLGLHNGSNYLFNVFGTGGVTVGIAPTGGNKGVGTINVAADIYKNNNAYTNPDYVLEYWATGKVEKFADKDGAKEYTGLLPLAEVEEFARKHWHLPRFGQDSGHGIFSGSDSLLASVEELYLYLFALRNEFEAYKSSHP